MMGEQKSKLQTAYNDMMIEMKELFNLGVLQGPDFMIMERTLTNPTTITAQVLEQMGGIAAFEAQLNLVQQKLDDARSRAAWLATGAPTTPAQSTGAQELLKSLPPGSSIRELP